MHFFARHRENIRQSAMSARLLWPCLLLVVLLVLTLRKTGRKLSQAVAAVRGDPEFRWQQRPGRRRPREGLLNRLLQRHSFRRKTDRDVEKAMAAASGENGLDLH